MTETRIADVVVPSVFSKYMLERSLNESAFTKTGALIVNNNIAELLSGGGTSITVPYWKDLTGSTDIPSETVATTVNNITTGTMVARRQFRVKAWGSNALSAALSGDNPGAAILSRVSGFWSKAIDDLIVYSLRGIIADNIANDSGDLVNNISTETGLSATSANKMDAIDTIDAIFKQGDKFSELSTIVMHSAVYANLVKNDLIDIVKDSATSTTINYYLGLRVIVSDNMPKLAGDVNGYKYHTYALKAGSIAFNETTKFIQTVEVARDASVGGGLDILHTRRQFVIHPLGFSWVLSPDSGVTPTDANLYGAASWNRVNDPKNTGIIAIISNG